MVKFQCSRCGAYSELRKDSNFFEGCDCGIIYLKKISERDEVQAFNRADINGGTLHSDEEVYINGFYQVNLRRLPGGWLSLAIKRLDKEAIHDWRELQQIKNLLCGAESEALELYPAESRLVDSCNQYYLWVLPPGDKFPFGFTERFIVKGHKGGYMKGSGQRDFKDDEQPKDAMDSADADKLAEEYMSKNKTGKWNI